jgi:hypothetical protein
MREALVKQPAQTGIIPAVHMNHAGIALERIITGGIDTNQIARMRSLRT